MLVKVLTLIAFLRNKLNYSYYLQTDNYYLDQSVAS